MTYNSGTAHLLWNLVNLNY